MLPLPCCQCCQEHDKRPRKTRQPCLNPTLKQTISQAEPWVVRAWVCVCGVCEQTSISRESRGSRRKVDCSWRRGLIENGTPPNHLRIDIPHRPSAFTAAANIRAPFRQRRAFSQRARNPRRSTWTVSKGRASACSTVRRRRFQRRRTRASACEAEREAPSQRRECVARGSEALPPCDDLRAAATAEAERLAQLEALVSGLQAAVAADGDAAGEESSSSLAELISLAKDLGVNDKPHATARPRPKKQKGPRASKEPRLPYRVFRSENGAEIRVGKQAKDNDVLDRPGAPRQRRLVDARAGLPGLARGDPC